MANSLVDKDSTVSGQVEGLIKKGSPLLTQAQTATKQEFQNRGLLSSSMAAEAGQEALYKSAMPIAQQDASTYAASGLSTQEANQELALSKQEAEQELELTKQKGIETKSIDAQSQKATSDLSTQQTDEAIFKAKEQQAIDHTDMGIQAYYDAKTADIASTYDLQLQKLVNSGQLSAATVNNASNKAIADANIAAEKLIKEMGVDSANYATFNGNILNAGNTLMASNLDVMLDTSMTTDQKTTAMANNFKTFQVVTKAAASIASIDLQFVGSNALMDATPEETIAALSEEYGGAILTKDIVTKWNAADASARTKFAAEMGGIDVMKIDADIKLLAKAFANQGVTP